MYAHGVEGAYTWSRGCLHMEQRVHAHGVEAACTWSRGCVHMVRA